MNELWIKAQLNAKEKYEIEHGTNSWEEVADKYEREDYCFAEYENLKKENGNMYNRDLKTGRFVSNKKESDIMNNSRVNTTTNTNSKEIKTMNKESRMEVLRNNGISTENFFSVTVNAPVGASVQIIVDGVPYTVNSIGNVVTDVKGENGAIVTDKVVEEIMRNGYVFNRRTDGRWIAAQTFKMLNNKSYNCKTRQYEEGWDAYLRNHFSYMYQFDMVSDELHKLARMGKDNDTEFDRLSKFFTKEVVVELCKQYIRQLKKFVKNQPTHKCNGVPYVKLNRYGNVFIKDLQYKVYSLLEDNIKCIKTSYDYTLLERSFNDFKSCMAKLPHDTAKCPQWKDAFKGKGAYVTLLNIIKFHGVTIDGMNTYESVAHVESKLDEYKGEYWRFHEMLKKAISDNNFDLTKSIKSQR